MLFGYHFTTLVHGRKDVTVEGAVQQDGSVWERMPKKVCGAGTMRADLESWEQREVGVERAFLADGMA